MFNMSIHDFVEELKNHDIETYGYPERIHYRYESYVQCTKLRGKLKELLGIEAAVVYRVEEKDMDYYIKPGALHLDCLSMLVIFKSGKVVEFSNSEWGCIENVGNYKK